MDFQKLEKVGFRESLHTVTKKGNVNVIKHRLDFLNLVKVRKHRVGIEETRPNHLQLEERD